MNLIAIVFGDTFLDCHEGIMTTKTFQYTK